jgi:hypothetical protein
MGLPPLAHETLAGTPRWAQGAARLSAWSGVLLAVAAALAGGVLLVVYDRLSETATITADSANAVLQGRSIVDGNLLLSNWTLSGASFYATDLPFYALFAAIHGLSPDVAHEVGAAIYALLVLAACFLARGDARGLQAMGRMAVTLLLLIAPAPGVAVELLLLGPFHAGTTLVLLLALLALDAVDTRPLAGLAVGLLLGMAVLSDALALYVGVLPVVAVTVLRLAGGRRRPADRVLLGAAAISVPASLVVSGALSWLGAFTTVPLHASFAHIEDLPKNAALAVEGTLVLFGANFFGQPLASWTTLAILLHLSGLAFVLVVCRWTIGEWRAGRPVDRITQVLLVGMAFDVAAYLFSNQAIDLMTSRYLIPFLAFGAVLAGRAGADRLWASRVRGAAALVGVAYLLFLGVSLRTPAAPTPEAELGAFLAQNHLRYGIAAYWQASTITVQSGGRVRVRAVRTGSPQTSAYLWEAEGSWYDPAQPGNDARFVLRDTWDPRSIDRKAIEQAFGAPSSEYRIGRYEVLVWDRNLLEDVVH